jgi:hypothetical protein
MKLKAEINSLNNAIEEENLLIGEKLFFYAKPKVISLILIREILKEGSFIDIIFFLYACDNS